MLTVGKHKAHLYHGDQHPASLYLGDRLITGYKILKATGTGRVEIGEHPYKASLPSCIVYGEGKQNKLEGYNILNLLSGGQPPADSGIIITHDKIVIKKNFTRWSNKTGYITNNLYNSGKLQWNVSCKVQGEFTGRIYGIFGFSMFDRNVINGEYRREEDYRGRYPDKLGLDISSNYMTILSDELVISDIMITMPDKGFPPYEPYCGGIPAPNPQYPIEPVFLDGASVVGRGRNLALPSDKHLAAKGLKVMFITNDPGRYTVTARAYELCNILLAEMHPGDNPDNYKSLNDVSQNNAGHKFWLHTHNTVGDKMTRFNVTSGNQLWVLGAIEAADVCVVKGEYDGTFISGNDLGTASLPILRALPDGSVRDEIDVVSGTVTRRIGEEEWSGEERWERLSEASRPFIFYGGSSAIEDNKRVLSVCKYYKSIPRTFFSLGIYNFASCVAGHFRFVADDRFTSIEEWKEYLSDQKASGHPVTIWYALKDPIIEHYDPAILRQHPGYTQLIQQGGELQAEIEAEYYKEVK